VVLPFAMSGLSFQKLLNMILLDFVRLGLAIEPPAHGGEIDADLFSKLLLGDSVF